MRFYVLLAAAALANASAMKLPRNNGELVEKRQDYFQTTPEYYAGPTATGAPAFLAQTNPAPFAGTTYIPPQPIETQEPISGAKGRNIFEQMGNMSPYFPNPDGFGVKEYPLPTGANITWFQMLSRHGARYNTGAPSFVSKLAQNSFKATGALAFLNDDWSYELGAQILVPIGNQELFDSGVLHQYLYGALAPTNGTKIVARSTTEDRMTKSAEYFLAGFFGLDWTKNASLELIIEGFGFNNSLIPYGCPKAFTQSGGTNASLQWQSIYLAAAQKRLNKLIGFENSSVAFTIADVYGMQTMCPYETISYGYSAFCELFTYGEYEGLNYWWDLYFAGNWGFQSSTGRASGIGWVQELLGRLTHHYVTTNTAFNNVTLDDNPITFPLYQTLNFDFTHDADIISVLTALGFVQFSQFNPATQRLNNRQFISSHLVPFGARMDIELIQTPSPLSPKRGTTKYLAGDPTTYIHFMLNQRTIGLGYQYPACGNRDDGWCELGTFLDATADLYAIADWEFACYGDYPSYSYGSVNNGNPNPTSTASNVLNKTAEA